MAAKLLLQLDNLLGRITMYKLVLWTLRILAAVAIAFSAFGLLHVSMWGQILSLGILIGVSQLANTVFARIWKVPTNTESYAITLLILFFLLPPPATLGAATFIAVAGVIAVASKFIITVSNRHLFNPAAFAAFLVGLLGIIQPSWWIGSKPLWPLMLIGGFLVVRKIRRFALFITYAVFYVGSMTVSALMHHQEVGDTWRFILTSTPFLFLGTIMLTEPATMPARREDQYIFGALVGLLAGYPWVFGGFQFHPETALLIGNLFAFWVNPHYRLRLTLQEVQHVSDRVYNYVFTPDRRPAFVPGQYMEFTQEMSKHDSRGNRRTFSLASSPTEQNVQLGVKFYQPSSRFKQVLHDLQPGAVLYASAVAGDFTLPADKSEKLAFIAGGIGITPFRSMLKYIVDKNEARDITMIYAVSDPAELAYKDVLAEAAAKGVRVIVLLTADQVPNSWQGSTGRLTPEFIAEHIPDHAERTFMLSGPQPMIEALQAGVHKIGAKNMKTDYFTGY